MLGPSFWLDLPKLLLQLVVKISILCRVILMDPPMAPRRSVFTLVQSSLQCSSVPPSVPPNHAQFPSPAPVLPKLPGHFAFACPTFQCQLQKRKKDRNQKAIFGLFHINITPNIAQIIPQGVSSVKSRNQGVVKHCQDALLPSGEIS